MDVAPAGGAEDEVRSGRGERPGLRAYQTHAEGRTGELLLLYFRRQSRSRTGDISDDLLTHGRAHPSAFLSPSSRRWRSTTET